MGGLLLALAACATKDDRWRLSAAPVIPNFDQCRTAPSTCVQGVKVTLTHRY